MTATGVFPESRLAHQLLDGLRGIEIGPAAHNPFGLDTKSVGLSWELDPIDYALFEKEQRERCGRVAAIDIPGDAAALPLASSSIDFVLHSHVWEHLPNPLRALEEWVRVVRPDGYIFCIVPTRDALESDRDRQLTGLMELVEHYQRGSTYHDRTAEMNGPYSFHHYTIFSPRLLREIARWYNSSHPSELVEVAFQERDDKVGNGHVIAWQVKRHRGLRRILRVFKGKKRVRAAPGREH